MENHNLIDFNNGSPPLFSARLLAEAERVADEVCARIECGIPEKIAINDGIAELMPESFADCEYDMTDINFNDYPNFHVAIKAAFYGDLVDGEDPFKKIGEIVVAALDEAHRSNLKFLLEKTKDYAAKCRQERDDESF